ncbi:hypothetical protein BD408DRAFT_422193 [Parasitella parasitica]|nr:hypothetical protein BD408DRAFT_422193 [Parasitella parasitica]
MCLRTRAVDKVVADKAVVDVVQYRIYIEAAAGVVAVALIAVVLPTVDVAVVLLGYLPFFSISQIFIQ